MVSVIHIPQVREDIDLKTLCFYACANEGILQSGLCMLLG